MFTEILPSGLHSFQIVPVGRIVLSSTHSAVNCASLILSSEPRLCIPFILFPQEAELRSALEEMGLAWILSSVNLYFWSFCSTGRWTPAHAGRDGFSLNCLLFSFWRLILTSSLLQTKMMHFFLQELSVFYQRSMSVEWHKTKPVSCSTSFSLCVEKTFIVSAFLPCGVSTYVVSDWQNAWHRRHRPQ